MLSAHYRSPLNFSADLMEASKNSLERILNCTGKLDDLLKNASGEELQDKEQEGKKELDNLVGKYEEMCIRDSGCIL